MDWKAIITGIIIGVILGIGGTLIILRERITRLETEVENLKSQINQPSPTTQRQELETFSRREPKNKPEQLISIIQEQQRKNVKESWGELAYQCFTDDDLARFIKNKRTEQIRESLKRDPEFLDVVLAIRQMEPSERKKLLISADKPLRPTWAELGRISREGQTEAGQEAERMIATAIVKLVKELSSISEIPQLVSN
jgi:predicted small secreted protein